jgi:uncharacterized membrane protein YfcA
VLLVAGLAVLVGALVQGVVGLGLGLIAAPVLAMLDPTLVPATLLLVTCLLPLLTALRELKDVDWRGLRWALAGRMPGTAVGAYAVARLPERGLALLVAIVVLGAVLASVSRWHARPVAGSLVVGGFVSGVAGTATSIGGPPMALLYQHASGPRLRSTLAVFFFVGTVVSLLALAVAGEMGERDAQRALLLMPFMLVGFAASGRLRPRLDRGWTRPAVLGVATVAAVALLVRSVG